MKFLLATVFIFCFYSFFHFLNAGYDFLKNLRGGATVWSEVDAKYYLKRQKSPGSFVASLNLFLFISFACVIFSIWLIYKIYPWWVIPITVFLGMAFGSGKRGEGILLDDYMRGAKKTLIVGIIIMLIVFVVWVIK